MVLRLLAPGGNLSLTLNGTIDFPPVGDSATNQVDVTGYNILGELNAELDDEATTLILFPDMQVEKSATASVNAGEAILYQITYENVGTAEAVSVVVTDTLPEGVYYSIALDQGSGPPPDSVTDNPDGTTTLRWDVGTVTAASGPLTIQYTARPSLLLLEGETVVNDLTLDFSDANNNDYPEKSASATTDISIVEPTENPLSMGYWRNHEGEWTGEILARIQATDQRFDGADGSLPDGLLSSDEVKAALSPGGNQPKVLRMQLLAAYFNLATRRINAGTTISSSTADDLGLSTVQEAAIYAMDTLSLPVEHTTRTRYSQATKVLDEINNNKSEVY